jgi:hypothetical protein
LCAPRSPQHETDFYVFHFSFSGSFFFLLPSSSFLRFFSYSIQMLVEFVLMPLINCTLAPLFFPSTYFSVTCIGCLSSLFSCRFTCVEAGDFCFRSCTLRGGPNDDGISAVDDVTYCLFSVIRTLNPVQKGCIRLFVTEVLQFSVSTGIIC